MPTPQLKGTIVIGLVKALKSQTDAARKVLSPSVAHYLDDRILVSGWYPETDALELIHAVAKISRGLGGDPYFAMGRASAHDHAKTSYKSVLTGRGTQRIFELITTAWKNQHDSGEMTSVIEGPTSARIDLVGHSTLCDEWCRLLRGYFVGLVEVSGGTGAKCDVIESDFARKRAAFRVSYTASA